MCAFNIAVTAVTRPQRVRDARATGRATVAGRPARSIRPVTVIPTRPAAAAARPGAGRRRLDNAPGNPWHGAISRPHEQLVCLFRFRILIVILYKSIHDSVSCVASRAAIRTHGRLRVAQSERRQSRRCATVPVCSLISLHASCGPAPLPHARASLQSMCPQTRAERCLAVFDSTHINTRANRCASSS